MKIVQIAENLIYGDGVSNCILSLSRMLDELGYSNIIMALNIDNRITRDRHIVQGKICELRDLDENNIIIYPFSGGSILNYIVENLPHKKILVYQNVTTPDFFRGIDYPAMQFCLWGIFDASKTAGNYLKSIVLSQYSKDNLVEMGWKAEDVSILPLINVNTDIPKANSKLMDKYNDGYVNILFTGRVAPNKKIEDIIKVFSCYQKNYNAKSRLILVGNTGYKNYYYALLAYSQRLKAENVVFTGHVSNEDLEAYYAVADVFLCMSEHEGFCIPLVEAMKREIPIIAYQAAAVPDTLGEAGVLVETKDERVLADIIEQLISDLDYREKIVQSQNQRLNFLGLENYKSDLDDIIKAVCQTEEFSYVSPKEELVISYLEKLKPDCIDKLIQLQKNFEKIIIYGIGKVGKWLLAEIENELGDKIIICDNTFPEKDYNRIAVLKHKECVEQYPNALYIITVQNACVDIIAGLLSNNISKQNIRFFNSSSGKIV